MAELRRECDEIRQELEREREQCRQLVDAEKRDAAAAKDKLIAQMTQLRCANEQVNVRHLSHDINIVSLVHT